MEIIVNWAIVIGAIGGVLIVIGKFVHKALSSEIINKMEKMHTEYMNETKMLKREVFVLGKEQSEIKIEQRGNRMRSESLAAIMREALLNLDMSKKLNLQFREINESVDKQLEESDNMHQVKINLIENEINNKK